MKGMPLPYYFEGKGVFKVVADTSLSDSSSNPLIYKWRNNNHNNKEESEPTSVLDNISSSPSPPTSTSTLSSSFAGGVGGGSGGGGGGGVAGNPSQKWPPPPPAQQETSSSNAGVESGCGSLELHHPVLPSLEIGGGVAPEKCGLGLEDWEGVLSESGAASPSQEQSILRWIMGDMEDPSMGLNKMLQIGGSGLGSASASASDFEFNGGFGIVDQGFGFDHVGNLNPSLLTSGFPNKFNNEKINLSTNPSPNLPNYKLSNPQIPMLSPISNQPQQTPFESSEVKPQMLINPQQAQPIQNPSFFLPLSYTQQEQHLLMPPQPKRHNSGSLDLGQELFVGRQHHHHQPLQGLPNQLQLVPPYLQPTPAMAARPKIVGDEMGHHNQHQQEIIDQLYKASSLVQSGNFVLAQGILARLNHQLSPIGKPFLRAAFYCKEALQLLLHTNNNNNMVPSAANSPFCLIFKIGAYKSLSEISPMIQFANFTCNQALLEALDGFDRIHIVDFDIGYGGQWASFMQELSLRNGGAPALKITAFASPSTHDQLELGLTQENLNHFASEINMAAFEFEIVSLDALNSWSFNLSESEAIAVNLPVGSLFNHQVPLHSVLRFVKHLSPKIVISVDRGCDRTDLPFPNHVIHALQSYSNLLESLDAVNMNLDGLQKIERFLLQPEIEKIVMGRYRSLEKTQHWRTLFLSSGFSPLTFSNFTESQAECVVKRTPVRGFHVEKRHSSLVLCWQRRELVSASVWRC